MLCLFCGNKVGYLRKLAGRNFCCDEHEKAYSQKQDELALARLLEDSFAAHPEPGIEAAAETEEAQIDFDASAGVLEPPQEPEPAPEPAGFLAEWPPVAASEAGLVAAEGHPVEPPQPALPLAQDAVLPSAVTGAEAFALPVLPGALAAGSPFGQFAPVAFAQPDSPRADGSRRCPSAPVAGTMALRLAATNQDPSASSPRAVPAFTIPLIGPESIAFTPSTGLSSAEPVRMALSVQRAEELPLNGVAPSRPAPFHSLLLPGHRRGRQMVLAAHASPIAAAVIAAADSPEYVAGAGAYMFPAGAPVFQRVSGVRLCSFGLPASGKTERSPSRPAAEAQVNAPRRTVVMPGSGRRLALPGVPAISPALEPPTRRTPARNGGSRPALPRPANGHAGTAKRKPVLAGANHLPSPDLTGRSPVPIPVEACGAAAHPISHGGDWAAPHLGVLALTKSGSSIPEVEFRDLPHLGADTYRVLPRPTAHIGAPGRVRGFVPGSLLQPAERRPIAGSLSCLSAPRVAGPVAAVSPAKPAHAGPTATNGCTHSGAWLRPSLPPASSRSETATLARPSLVSLPLHAADRWFRHQSRASLRFPMPAACKPGFRPHLATVAGLLTAGPLRSRHGPPAGSAAAPYAEVSALDSTPETEPAGGPGASAPQLTLASAFPPAGKSADIPIEASAASAKTWKILVRPQGPELDRSVPKAPQPEQAPEFAPVPLEGVRIFKPVKRGRFEFVVLKWQVIPGPVRKAAMALPAIAALLLLVPDFSSRTGAGLLASAEGALKQRAAVELEDDFRSGLSRWQGGKDWARGWQYDPAGFLRPGRSLSLLRDSLPLSTYRMEFLAQIEQKAVTWVIRAKDIENYYCYKIVITKPGPLPSAAIVRYTVLNGRASGRTQLPLPLNIRNDTMYEVSTHVRGPEFTTYVNGQLVDTWSDTALAAGGVGFFCDRGEAARLRWVRLTDRDDIVGKVCSYLSRTK